MALRESRAQCKYSLSYIIWVGCVCARKTRAASCTVRTFFPPWGAIPSRRGWKAAEKIASSAARVGGSCFYIYGSGARRRPGHFWYCIRFAKIASRIERKAKKAARRRPKIFGPELTEWPGLSSQQRFNKSCALSELGNLSLCFASAFMLRSFHQ